MAVTSSFLRNHKTTTNETDVAYCTATLGGTYATGGFTWNPLTIPGSAGTSPMPASTPFRAVFWSPTGYMYATTITNAGLVYTATTKIYSAAGTELANGTAVPDATVPVDITMSKR